MFINTTPIFRRSFCNLHVFLSVCVYKILTEWLFLMDIWGNGSVFISPFFSVSNSPSSECTVSMKLCRQTVYSCCLPHSKSFPLFKLPPLSLTFGFFSVFLFCCFSGGSNLKLVSVWQRSPSSVYA